MSNRNVDTVKFHLDKLFFERFNITKGTVTIAGGYIRDNLAGEKAKDVDIFPKTKEAQDAVIAALTAVKAPLNQNDALVNFVIDGIWFQVVCGRFHETPKDLVDTFDYSICCVGYDGSEFYCHPNFFEDVLTKRLRWVVFNFPLSSLERLQKYANRGYQACNGTMLELSKAIAQVNFDNPSENQLTFYTSGDGKVSPRFVGID